jgi:hypothetical protein
MRTFVVLSKKAISRAVPLREPKPMRRKPLCHNIRVIAKNGFQNDHVLAIDDTNRR